MYTELRVTLNLLIIHLLEYVVVVARLRSAVAINVRGGYVVRTICVGCVCAAKINLYYKGTQSPAIRETNIQYSIRMIMSGLSFAQSKPAGAPCMDEDPLHCVRC